MGNASNTTKKLINSNVAIELGYALRHLTDENLLLVFNTQYGAHEELPFDLRHKGGAITFRLAPDAAKQEIDGQRKHLKDRFVNALRPYLQRPGLTATLFPETPTTYSKATYFDDGEILARAGSQGNQEVTFSYTTPQLAYLRLIPKTPLAEQLPLARLVGVAQRVPLLVDQRRTSGSRNRYGGIAYQPAAYPDHGPAPLAASTQLFQNGEIWCISATVMTTTRNGRLDRPRLPFIAALAFERIFDATVNGLLRFVKQEFALPGPWRIECGLTGTNGLYIYGLKTGDYKHDPEGPVLKDEIVSRGILQDDPDKTVDDVLAKFFDHVYDAVGVARPTHLLGG